MTRIQAEQLRDFGTGLLAELGAPTDVASTVADSLVAADLRGHTSHGVLRIPTYGAMIGDGALVPDATPAVVRAQEQTAVIDGKRAFGQVVGRRAVDVLVENAREGGLAGVGIRNGTHLGRIGEWAECVTEEGLCFASFVNTSGGGLVVAPAGSTTRRFSTNPLTYGVPTFDRLPFPLVLDMATSQVAHGKLDAYQADGRSIPGEWAVGDDGAPLTDPAAMDAFSAADPWGAIRPLGGTTAGYKGTGLALMTELFAGLLGGGPVVGQRDSGSWFSNGAVFLAIDPTAFSDRETMTAQVDAVVTHFREADSHPDVPVGAGARGEDPLLPGEAEYQARRNRSEEGIPLPTEVTAGLSELAAEYDVANPLAED
ncbi:MAG: Ldh family oxidoreductase [Haloarculaceae archaeon]